MQSRHASRVIIALATPIAMLLAAPTAQADAVNVVSAESHSAVGSVSGRCAFAATLPQAGSFNEIPVAFTGTATATNRASLETTGPVPPVVVSTSIRCFLRNGGRGGEGITLVGPTAAIAGTGVIDRLAPAPEICTVVAAALSNGTTIPERTNCARIS